jgi:phage shock protein A
MRWLLAIVTRLWRWLLSRVEALRARLTLVRGDAAVERKIAAVERAIAEAERRLRPLEVLIEHERARVDELEEHAMKCVRSGDDPRARTLLAEAVEHKETAQKLTQQRDAERALIAALERQHAMYSSLHRRKRR